jgi:hypothetical protein
VLRESLTFSPRLSTSPNRQLKRIHESRDEFYNSLYSWREYFSKRRHQRTDKDRQTFSVNSPFRPEINKRSRKLAESRLSNRRRHSFDATSTINTESIAPFSAGPYNNSFLSSPLVRSVGHDMVGEVEVPNNRNFSLALNPSKSDLLASGNLNEDVIEMLQMISLNENISPAAKQKDEAYWIGVMNSQQRPQHDQSSNKIERSRTPLKLSHLHVASPEEKLETRENYLFLSNSPAFQSGDVFERLYQVIIRVVSQFGFFPTFDSYLSRRQEKADCLHRKSLERNTQIVLLIYRISG